jgi:GNAT superfamily N-acetyltransferase
MLWRSFVDAKPERRNLSFPVIEEADIKVLTSVMKRAFDDDAQMHLGQESGGPPGYDDGEFFRIWLLPYEESVGYKIMSEESVIGGIIVWILPEGHNILGTIFVDPDFQDIGVGEQAWRFIEETYPTTISWRLSTPTRAIKNHHYYVKCGFSVVDSDPLIPDEDGFTIYRKEIEHP